MAKKRIGIIDADLLDHGTRHPNLALMKISAYHKAKGDTVNWYYPLLSGEVDKVYISKVFSFTPDIEFPIYSKEIIKGGSGFAITVNEDGKEVYNKELDKPLPYEIEHIYPDYDIYGVKDTAYGFLTRGCPRGCKFCHVQAMQGVTSVKVADLNEFWRGQKNIILYDANITACKEWRDLFTQLSESKAYVNFSQGLDARLMTVEKAEALKQIKIKEVHFAWDRYEDKEIILPKLKMIKDVTGWRSKNFIVYCIVGDKERQVTNEDLERVYSIRDIGMFPYIMIYNKQDLPRGHELRKLQRYVNNKFIFQSCNSFEEYLRKN